MANAARQDREDPSEGEGTANSSMDREADNSGVTGLRSDLQKRVNAVTNRMPANNANFYREEAAPAADPAHATPEAANNSDHHGGHGNTRKSKKPAIPSVSNETVADLIETGTTFRDFYRKYRKGAITTPDVARLFNDTLDTLGMDKLRMGSNIYAWILGLALHIPDHPPANIAANYSDLGGQILGFHPDEDNPNSYHHSVEGLMANINEMDLHRHYSLFFHQPNFTKAMSNAKGQKKAQEQFYKLFGPDIETRDQFLDVSSQVLLRLGCHVTPGPNPADPTVGETIAIHDLRNVHGNHSLHAFVLAIQNARQWVNAANIGQIAEPATEDIKLSKDMNKFGDTLMEQVKGTPGLVVQFLGNVNLAAYDKAFHSLANNLALDDGMYDEPELVREQICQLFNFSAKERISANDLNSFTETLIGPTTATPAVPPYALDGNNGGALGLLSAIPATDTATRAKWLAVRTRVNEARARLLATPTGGTGTRLDVLFPDRKETIKYEEFGNQLGKVCRKTGVALDRGRAAFLRGWDAAEFRDHFLTLVDPATLTAIAAGGKAEKEDAKLKIAELTGIKAKKITPVLFTGRMTELLTAVAGAVPPELTAKQTALNAVLTTLNTQVAAQIESLYLDVNLEEKLGEALQSVTDAATVSAILDRISIAFLMSRYPRVQTAPATVLGPPPMSLTNQQLLKANLAAFIGAPKGFVWTDAAVSTMIGTAGGLRAKLALVPATHSGRIAMEAWITYVEGFVATPGLIDHLGTLP